MNSKALIWIGMTVGSIAGSFLPALWGGDLLSFAGLVCSGVGGIAGIWAGYRIGNLE
jgi:hypothetical protein